MPDVEISEDGQSSVYHYGRYSTPTLDQYVDQAISRMADQPEAPEGCGDAAAEVVRGRHPARRRPPRPAFRLFQRPGRSPCREPKPRFTGVIQWQTTRNRRSRQAGPPRPSTPASRPPAGAAAPMERRPACPRPDKPAQRRAAAAVAAAGSAQPAESERDLAQRVRYSNFARNYLAARRRLMARACTVCLHPDREAVDKAMVEKSESHRAIAHHYGISRYAVDRHVQHISAALKTVRLNRETGAAESLMARIEHLISRVENFLSTAERSGQVAQGLAAVRELRALLELLGKASGELKPDGPAVTINVLQSPEVLQVIRAVRHVLADQPERLEAFSAYLKLPEHIS